MARFVSSLPGCTLVKTYCVWLNPRLACRGGECGGVGRADCVLGWWSYGVVWIIGDVGGPTSGWDGGCGGCGGGGRVLVVV